MGNECRVCWYVSRRSCFQGLLENRIPGTGASKTGSGSKKKGGGGGVRVGVGLKSRGSDLATCCMYVLFV